MHIIRRAKSSFGIAAVGVALVVSTTGAASAVAATNLGSTTSPPAAVCSAGDTFIQVVSPPSTQYQAPATGVITSWAFHAAAGVQPTLKLKIFRDTGPAFLVVGHTPTKTPLASTVNSYPAQIPVQVGDFLGLSITGEGPCGTEGGAGQALSFPGDPDPGTIVTPPDPPFPGEFPIGAQLEPDVDNDGFGDETQDQCPSNTAAQKECVAPETTITKAPKAKTKKSTAKLTFQSNEAGSSFQCRLNGKGLKPAVKQFAPCVSPKKYKNLDPGKYRFAVFATDAAGNADPTPAKKKFRVLE